MTIARMLKNVKRRGKKRLQYSSSESESDDSGVKHVVVKKLPIRPGTPRPANLVAPEDDTAKTSPKAEWPVPSNQKKNENEDETDRCKCGNCKTGPDRFSGILRNKSERYPSKVRRVGYEAARGKRKEISKKDYASDVSNSANNSKRSSEKSSLKRHRYKSESPGARSIDSRSSCSGRSSCSRRSSGRSSARSMESMDGQTELLESLMHAAHAEDKLLREKQELRNELQKRKKVNDELEAELLYALKVVDELSTKYKAASKNRHEMEQKLNAVRKERSQRA